MVHSCAAWNCTYRRKKRSKQENEERKSDITLIKFPHEDPTLMKKWLVAMKREDYTPTGNSRLCTQHFKPTDYYERGRSRRRYVHYGVVPSIWNFPERLTPKPKTLRSSKTSTNARKSKSTIESNRKKGYRLSPRKLIKRAQSEHGYCETPEQKLLKQKRKENLAAKTKKTLANLRQRYKRKDKKCQKMKDLIQQLQKNNLIKSDEQDLLESAFGGMSLALFRHIRITNRKRKGGERYNDTVASFALTLYYLSPSAYDFLKPTLKLPHPNTLRTWRASINGKPGYITEVLEAVQKLIEKDAGLRFCTMAVDEMAIRKYVEWNRRDHAYSGNIDYGSGPVGDRPASNALVFMLICMKGRWKVPISYVLTDHITGEQLHQLTHEAMIRAADYGIQVKAIVSDGLSANMKAAELLGCKISATEPQPSFQHPHPNYSTERVFFICDAVHMMKLMRNLLFSRKVIHRKLDDGKIEKISCHYIVELEKLQRNDSLYLANKLTGRHINFNNVKMKVNLAVQTLSASVAAAIDFLRDDMEMKEFADSEATCKFIRIMDRLFDVLNSKNAQAKGYKAALGLYNQNTWLPFLHEAIAYLRSLCDPDGKPLYATRIGTTVKGFIVTSTSVIELATSMLATNDLQYLLTYKLSQDHIEMFFSKIRRRCGWNNNPTSLQFRAALQTLVVRNCIGSSRYANSVDLDGTTDVHLDFRRNRRPTNMGNIPTADDFSSDPEFLAAVNKLDSAFKLDDKDWRVHCLTYTAGFVVRRIRKSIKCPECSDALTVSSSNDEETPPDAILKFLQRRNRGGLLTPSAGVVRVIQCAEQAFRVVMPDAALMSKLPHEAFLDLKMQSLVISKLRNSMLDIFPSLFAHFYDHEVIFQDDHVTQLIRVIVSYYIRMRMHKSAVMHHARALLRNKSSKRMKSNKLVLFSGE